MWIWCHFLQRTHGGSCSLSFQEHTAQLGGGMRKFPSWEHKASCKNPWEHEMLRVEMTGEGLRARATDRAYLQSLHPGPIPGEIPTPCVSAFWACLSSRAHPEGVWRTEERGSCPWVSSCQHLPPLQKRRMEPRGSYGSQRSGHTCAARNICLSHNTLRLVLLFTWPQTMSLSKVVTQRLMG